ncbi:MAG: hypothetical protein H0U45_15825 [Tatlockia sp.]|nr:hypothetical protein [Tatlockia sp.]
MSISVYKQMSDQRYMQDEKTGRFTSSGLPVVARKPISVKLPPEIDDVVRSMPNRAEFLREVITKAVLEREQRQDLSA